MSVNTWIVSENAFYASTSGAQGSPELPAVKHIRSQETVFTIGSGYFCTRGTFEEGYPHASPATLLYGVFDNVPIAREELANVPNWTSIKLFVNGERFRLDRGRILEYQRELRLRDGVLSRSVLWQSPSGVQIRVSIERFASLADVHVGVVRYNVAVLHSPENQPVDIQLRGSLEGAQGNYDLLHWETVDQGFAGEQVWLLSETKASKIQLMQSITFNLTTPGLADSFKKDLVGSDLEPAISFSGTLAPGADLTVEKIAVMYTSRDGMNDLQAATLSHLGEAGPAYNATQSFYESLLAESADVWGQYWGAADVILEGDDKAQLGLRYNLYQLRINVLPGDSRYSIAAKGMTGFGYRGHVFHDTEIFMLPFFTYVLPDIARDLLLYRYNLLPAARAKAASNGYQGAQFPWESTLDGKESTPPSIIHPETGQVIVVLNGSIELHITSSIAHATWVYYQITEDADFLRDYGAELLLSAAQFWVSRFAHDPKTGDYVINDVIGPDEWHEHVNNNAYTNVMARYSIEVALEAWQWIKLHEPAKARDLQEQLALDEQQFTHWHEVIEHICVLQNPETGLIEQFDGFFKLPHFDQEKYAGRTDSYQGLLGMEETQKYQIIKQADVLMLLTVLLQHYNLKVKKVNWDYYYPITDHDYGSSLTPALHVILASELGEREAAYNLFMKGALVDLENLRGNTPEGIHSACAGAVWQAAILGVAGLRLTDDGYTTSPSWPDGWTRLAFSFCHKGQRFQVDLRR